MFDYEKLEVWERSLNLSCYIIAGLDRIETGRKHYRLFEQIEASSTSVPMNIAEGKGRHSKKEFVQYLYIARGSLYETITLLESFRRLNWVSREFYDYVKAEAEQIAKMLNGLISSIKVSIN